MSTKPKQRDAIIREVTAPTIIEAVEHLDGLNKSCFDMYLVHMEDSVDREGYVTIKVLSWENFSTRENLPC